MQQVRVAPTIPPSSNSPAQHSSLVSMETLKDGSSRQWQFISLCYSKSIAQASNSKWEICISRWKSWWAHSHFKLLYPLFFLTCLLVLSSFKGLALSTIPNAHMEANKYALLVPSYESSNVKVTWQIFSSQMSKQPWTSPEGTVFQKLCETDWQAKKTQMLPLHISLWKTPVNGILTVQTVTLGNTPS